ncbi:FHA domain-containing protein [Candidatus Uabimicrobium sp. HlEnr_7]|uniref:FHA domain-containing protein n=1 Tax=Candidatus Uabimicrobium helgolandensis TaxID=3095367 RepID=UPI003557B900
MDRIKPCLYDEKKGLKFELEFTSDNKIGRGTSPKAKNITINLVNESVSSNHAIIRCRKGNWVLCDESTHGSKVNEKLVHQSTSPLRHKDKIQIGEYQFIFFDEEAISSIGGTQEISLKTINLEKTTQKQTQTVQHHYDKWEQDRRPEIIIIAFICMILFMVLFIGIFFNFFFQL